MIYVGCRRKADGAMSRRLASPAGNYYKFVYEDDDDDDDVDGDVTSDQYPISPVEDLQAQQQQMYVPHAWHFYSN